MVKLDLLEEGDALYDKAQGWFEDGWEHPDKTYELEAIYYINPEAPDVPQQYDDNLDYVRRVRRRMGGSDPQEYLFHGTRRACRVGDDDDHIWPCNLSDCNFCHILKLSFSLGHASAGGMFGPGIYTSSVSSKADEYVMNYHVRSNKHAMFLSNVVTGNSEQMYTAAHGKRSPSPGYDSVTAVTRSDGGSVTYPETVVYRTDAILPTMVIIYTRTGWEPRH